MNKKRVSSKEESTLLPPPDHKHGYTDLYLDLCLIVLGVDSNKFWKAFGVNTCAYDEEKKCNVYYKCDIERALYKLEHKSGINHAWD
jgi:hypothetical protein